MQSGHHSRLVIGPANILDPSSSSYSWVVPISTNLRGHKGLLSLITTSKSNCSSVFALLSSPGGMGNHKACLTHSPTRTALQNGTSAWDQMWLSGPRSASNGHIQPESFDMWTRKDRHRMATAVKKRKSWWAERETRKWEPQGDE